MVLAIPSYAMNCIVPLMSLCEHIEGMIELWWGSQQEREKNSWIKWEALLKEKKRWNGKIIAICKRHVFSESYSGFT